MATSSRLALVVMMAVLLGTASAATYNVGEPSGSWDLRTNYGTWASSKSFHPGDSIVFKYSPQAHDVVEVSKADYESCSNASPIGATYTSGDDTIVLASTGTRYFICGVPGHCAGGMKVQIDVVPSGTSSLAPAGAPGAANSPPSKPDSAATAKVTGFGALAAVMIAAAMIAY